MNLFHPTGAHVLVDGQFGSTGKGAFAAFLAQEAVKSGNIRNFQGAITNAGPNSGHTSYIGHQKVVLKQLSTFAVQAAADGHVIPIYLSAGAVINPDALRFEASTFPNIPIFVHPRAAVISEEDIKTELSAGPIRDIASTQSGTGAALARKIHRDPKAIAENSLHNMPPNVQFYDHRIQAEKDAYFIEVSQGFSLGIHSQFYPHTTSRECTVMQAIADARIPPRHVTRTYMSVRTFPIRVGNLDNHSSGGWYEDQKEVSWKDIGVEPELTTVTQRIRRVATFSMQQFQEAVYANDPDWVAVNFLNYMKEADQDDLINSIRRFSGELDYPFGVIAGYGPRRNNWTML